MSALTAFEETNMSKRIARTLLMMVVGVGICLWTPGLSESAAEEMEVRQDGEVPSVVAFFDMIAGLPCQLEAIEGGIRCTSAGMTSFEWHHPSLYPNPQSYHGGVDGAEPVEPVQIHEEYFYGVDDELLRFDSERRVIIERTRMPSTIVDIDTADRKLVVSVDASIVDPEVVIDAEGIDHQTEKAVDITVEPDDLEAPGRGPWNWMRTLGALRDAMWLGEMMWTGEPGGAFEQLEVDEEYGRAAVELLQWRQEHDVANAYLPLFRAEVLERLGDSEAADEAYREAAEHRHADWLDRARIALRLEYRGKQELASRAFDRAAAQMDEAGVRGQYVTAVVNVTYGLVWLQEAFHEALMAGDTDQLHRLARAVDRMFPNLEGAPAAWSRLAVYFDEQGESERAEHWGQRVDEIRAADRPDEFFEEPVSSVDLFLVLQMGLFLTVLFAGAICGLWRYEEDDESESDADESDSSSGADLDAWYEYLPRFQAADIASVAALLVVLLLLPTVAASPVQSMVTMLDAPTAASGDAVAAPSVVDWAEGLAESPARDELIAESRRELEATKDGHRGPGDVHVNQVIVEAVEADTDARGVRTFGDIEVSEPALEELEWLRPLIEFEFDTTGLFLLFFVLSMNVVIFGGLLQAVARRFPAVGRFGRAVVPGAPNSLRWLRLTVLTTFLVGLLMMTGLSQTIEASTEAALVVPFGLQEAPSGLSSATPTMGFVLVVVALVVHGIGVAIDRRT